MLTNGLLSAISAVVQLQVDAQNASALSGNVGLPLGGQPFTGVGCVGVNLVNSSSFNGTIQFQATTDGNTWFPVGAHPMLASGILGAPVTQTTAAGQFFIPVYGYYQVRVFVSGFTSGVMTAFLDAAASSPVGQLYANTEGSKPTYSAAFVNFTPVATATDIAQLVGSATKTVRLLRVQIVGLATAAAQIDGFALIKRTAANTGGTVAAQTITTHDSNDGAPTAVFNTYSVNPTGLGASSGLLRAQKLPLPAGPAVGPSLLWDFTNKNDKAPVLRGVAQGVSLSWGGAAVPAGTVLNGEIMWTEE